jgi:hypothetical protein
MEISLIFVLLVIWFLITFLYICFWIIGNRLKEKLDKFDYEKNGRLLIRLSVLYLIFGMIWILFLFITKGLTDEFVIGMNFSIVALFVSIGTFFLTKSQCKL